MSPSTLAHHTLPSLSGLLYTAGVSPGHICPRVLLDNNSSSSPSSLLSRASLNLNCVSHSDVLFLPLPPRSQAHGRCAHDLLKVWSPRAVFFGYFQRFLVYNNTSVNTCGSESVSKSFPLEWTVHSVGKDLKLNIECHLLKHHWPFFPRGTSQPSLQMAAAPLSS